MKLEDIDPSQQEFSDEELKAMGEILLKAEEIKADHALYNIVEKHMKKQVKKIKSLSDLRAKANALEMTPDPPEGA